MTDKVRKIKEWISNEQDGLMDAQGNFEYPEHEGAYHILCNLDAYIDSLQEEPTSEDLEEAARKAATWHSRVEGDKFFPNDYQKFIAGANWQKKQTINKTCEWLKSYRQDTPDGTGYIAGIVNDKTIEDFVKFMKGE